MSVRLAIRSRPGSERTQGTLTIPWYSGLIGLIGTVSLILLPTVASLSIQHAQTGSRGKQNQDSTKISVAEERPSLQRHHIIHQKKVQDDSYSIDRSL